MAGEIVEKVLIDIDGKTLIADEFSYKPVIEGEGAVFGMTQDNKIIGHKGGNVYYEITISSPYPADGYEVDLDAYMRRRTRFTVAAELDNGDVMTFTECVFTDVDTSVSHGDGGKKSLSIRARDMSKS